MKKFIIFFAFIFFNCEKEVLIEKSIKVSLINIVEEPIGTACSSGGFKIEKGIDLDDNGILETSEIQTTDYICNGNNGENGESGLNSLVNINQEPIGENCNNGGFKIDTGIDENNNDILDANEIQTTNYTCNGSDGINGVDGLHSLINILEEPAGVNCNEGGFKIETGIDTDNSGVLETNEIQATDYICNGNNGGAGLNSLINIIEELEGDNCNNGGFKIESGIDVDNNGLLEIDEVQTTNYICNGNNGEAGLRSLINIVEELEGDNCNNGGFKIDTGIDVNGDGILETNEIQATNYVCNGSNGFNGLTSLINVIEEPRGLNCIEGGFKIDTGIDFNGDGILEMDEIQTTSYICNVI